MAQTLGTIFKELATKAGLDLNDAKLKALLDNTTDVPDDTYQVVKSGLDKLMDENVAKNNSTLHNHFKALSLAPVDKYLNEQLDALGFDDAFKAEFKANGNSYDKMKKLVSKALEVEAGKHTGKDTDKAKLQSEINRLNGEIVKVRETAEAERQRLQSESENAVLNYALNSQLESKNYANENLPKKVNALTALTLLQEELTAKKAKVVRAADGSLKLIRSDNPDLDYTENNKPLSFGDFADSLLAKHNMLKVSDQPKKPGQQQQKPFVSIPGDQANEAVVASNDANLQALEASLGK